MKYLVSFIFFTACAFGMSPETSRIIRKINCLASHAIPENIDLAIRTCNYFINDPRNADSERVHVLIALYDLHFQTGDFLGIEKDFEILKRIAKRDPKASSILLYEYEIDFNSNWFSRAY